MDYRNLGSLGIITGGFDTATIQQAPLATLQYQLTWQVQRIATMNALKGTRDWTTVTRVGNPNGIQLTQQLVDSLKARILLVEALAIASVRAQELISQGMSQDAAIAQAAREAAEKATADKVIADKAAAEKAAAEKAAAEKATAEKAAAEKAAAEKAAAEKVVADEKARIATAVASSPRAQELISYGYTSEAALAQADSEAAEKKRKDIIIQGSQRTQELISQGMSQDAAIVQAAREAAEKATADKLAADKVAADKAAADKAIAEMEAAQKAAADKAATDKVAAEEAAKKVVTPAVIDTAVTATLVKVNELVSSGLTPALATTRAITEVAADTAKELTAPASKLMTYVLIGVGTVTALGAVIYFVTRKRKKSRNPQTQDQPLYNIIRFYKSGRRKIIHRNVTLAVAQLHCRDPRTKKEGVWFDGYDLARPRN